AGFYTLQLWARDDGQTFLEATKTLTIDVPQELAFGNFSLPFTDLSVNIAGIPIAITRSYDTRDAGQSLEFGHGWRLNLGKSTLKTENTAAGGFGVGGAFRDGTRVFVSLPGQRPMGFTF